VRYATLYTLTPAPPACQNASHTSKTNGQAGLPEYISKFIGKWAGRPLPEGRG